MSVLAIVEIASVCIGERLVLDSEEERRVNGAGEADRLAVDFGEGEEVPDIRFEWKRMV